MINCVAGRCFKMACLTRDLIAELECPVCLQYLTLPITLCKNGHSICQTCRSNVLLCPSCREEFTSVRCRAFENLVKGLQFTCKNQGQGCKEILTLEHIADHESICPFVVHECPLNRFERGCAWRGYFREFVAHVENFHKDVKIWRQPCFISRTTGKLKTVIECFGELFLYFKIMENGKWNFVVMILGSKKQASCYKTIFSLSGVDGVSGLVETQAMRSFNESLEEVTENYLCLRLDEKQAERFIQDNEFKLQITISKK